MIVRHKLLADLVRLWKNDQLVEKIDRLPIELSPRKSKPLGRCCVHKERAVWRYKTFPLMGLDMTDEHDEVTPLSEYARMALNRPEPSRKISCVSLTKPVLPAYRLIMKSPIFAGDVWHAAAI